MYFHIYELPAIKSGHHSLFFLFIPRSSLHNYNPLTVIHVVIIIPHFIICQL